MPKLDLFCSIVDNFGDIGVCWRLAKQLHSEHKWQVRLFIDSPEVAKRLIPTLDPGKANQEVGGINILHWGEAKSIDAADIVIEAFACTLPESYQQAMLLNKPLWLNLDYLSAETWVDDYHAQSSMHPQLGLNRHFFFPGFTEKTGGLIREHGLIETREVFQHSAELQQAFWQKLGIESDNACKVSLFCYAHAPVLSLLQSMEESVRPVLLLIPESIASEDLQAYLKVSSVQAGSTFIRGQLRIHFIPFLSQEDYDRLLWACDLNFVRGEDSWIRALWSARPFIWQPYRQEENAHQAKLEAFLDRYAANQLTLQQAHHAWLSSGYTHALWDTLCHELPNLQQHAEAQTKQWQEQTDLASKLVIFCKNLL